MTNQSLDAIRIALRASNAILWQQYQAVSSLHAAESHKEMRRAMLAAKILQNEQALIELRHDNLKAQS